MMRNHNKATDHDAEQIETGRTFLRNLQASRAGVTVQLGQVQSRDLQAFIAWALAKVEVGR